MKSLVLLNLFVYLTVINAFNDWKEPCLQGECWYDIPSEKADPFGSSLVITGARGAISDITSAAGWVILGCDSQAPAQEIRIVCAGEDNTDHCNHLFLDGAENKIIRLPENCGSSPFARVSRTSISSDQSLPPSVARRVSKPEEPTPLVHDISFDTDFGAADNAKNGDVSFALIGTNMQGFPVQSTLHSLASVRRSHITRGQASSFADQAFNSFKEWKKSASKSFPIVDIDKAFTLFDESISCPSTNGSGSSWSAEAKADLHGKAHVGLDIAIAASGKLIPPRVKEFSLFAHLNSQIDGKFELLGTTSATLDSGALTLLEIGIPSLVIPEIISIGPVFRLQGQGKLSLEAAAQMSVDLSYSVDSATISWPPSGAHPPTGLFNPTSHDFKLSIPPSYSSTTSLEVHLIPKIEFDISAFGDRFKSTVFILSDASTATTLDISAGSSRPPSRCVNAIAKLDIHAGADADFFGLFDKSTVLPIYQRENELFKKCFNTRSAKRGGVRRTRPTQEGGERGGSLICPSGSPPVLVSVTDL